MIALPASGPAARVVYRTRQGLAQLWTRPNPAVDAELRSLLSPEHLALLARLPFTDRRHLLEAGRRVAAESDDRELRLAALLHDAGKADERAGVRLPQRVLLVLLGRWAPGLLRRLARPSRLRWRHALYLGLEHPRLGAALAADAGAGARACWLIAHHHDPDAAAADPALRLLQRVDEEL